MQWTRRKFMGAALGGATMLAAGIRPTFASTEPIKIGILHSLSGTMAISETTLKT